MRKLSRMLLAALLAAVLLNPDAWVGCEPIDHSYSEAPPLRAEANQFAATLVTPHLEAAIAPHTNVLWCGTFQLAWNEVCKLAGGPLQFLPPQPEMATLLNKQGMTTADIDPQSCVAEAGYVRDGVVNRINQAVRARFGGSAPALQPGPSWLRRQQDIVAYSFLQKNLQFATPFEGADYALPFTGEKVSCFGMSPFKPGHAAMARQISILDYRGPDDFVIELKTKSAADRLILAKLAPGKTLAATLDALKKRIVDAKPIPAFPSDVLAVPKMNFDITRHYTELTDHTLRATAPGMADDLTLLAADQNTRFQLDEKGVKLRSEAHMEFGCSAPALGPLPEHVMVFDKPFLVILQRDNRKIPYFALWVGNTDLLIAAKK